VIYPFYAKYKDSDGYDITFVVDNTGIAICYSKNINSKKFDEFFYFIQCDLNYTLAKLVCDGLEKMDIDRYLGEVKHYYEKHTITHTNLKRN